LKKILTVNELAEQIGGEVCGDGSVQIDGVNAVDAASESQVTFAADDKVLEKLKSSKAIAVLVTEKIESLSKTQLVVEDVNTALIKTLEVFAPELQKPAAGVHASAVVADSAKVAASASIGSGVVIGENAEVGENTVIGANCTIGENSKVGDNCRLDSSVAIYHNCVLGNNVIIQANTTIGSVGFGYSFIDGAHRLIGHNGGVIIEDFVEIGANSCVDRAKFDNTVIGAGTKIDNMVQVGHNVVIGKCCLIVALTGIGGSCKIGDGVVLAGQVGLADHISIGDGAIVGAKAGVINDIEAGKQVVGQPAIDRRDAFRSAMAVRDLPKILKQVKKLLKLNKIDD